MFQKQLIKSPLRYPGGKSRAIEQICQHLPSRFTEFREPFVGGGSVFIYLRQRFPNIKIWINDLNQELYCFWKVTQTDSENLIQEIYRVKQQCKDGRELFTNLTTIDVSKLSEFERAVRFFVLNRITFSGTVESGGYSQGAFEKRFTVSAIKRLQPLNEILDGVKITNLDYKEVLQKTGEDVFIFLDPPYLSATNSRLYGKRGTLHTSFDHEEFAESLRDCKYQWLVTYDDSPQIRTNFDFANLYEWNLQYGMNNYKQTICKIGKELFVASYKIKEVETTSQASLFS
jgi:DNA adenine methylase